MKKQPPRVRIGDYRGLCILWDHHPHGEDQNYGAGTSADEIRAYVRAVRPDFMQIQALGCFGYTSFPSRIGVPVQGLVGDPLAVWSKVCAEEGIAFGAYLAAYAGICPNARPDWNVVTRDGNASTGGYCSMARGPMSSSFRS